MLEGCDPVMSKPGMSWVSFTVSAASRANPNPNPDPFDAGLSVVHYSYTDSNKYFHITTQDDFFFLFRFFSFHR